MYLSFLFAVFGNTKTYMWHESFLSCKKRCKMSIKVRLFFTKLYISYI